MGTRPRDRPPRGEILRDAQGEANTMVHVRIDRVTTRGGDKGTTILGDATRVPKDSPRVEAIGTVDEANAALGLLYNALVQDGDAPTALFVRTVQNDLFDVGADLAIPWVGTDPEPRIRVQDAQVAALEAAVAARTAQLPQIRSFILPGGSAVAARAHMARTIVRRAERRVVALATAESLNPAIIRYLNRLSDVLFVLARVDNERRGETVLWRPGSPRTN